MNTQRKTTIARSQRSVPRHSSSFFSGLVSRLRPRFAHGYGGQAGVPPSPSLRSWLRWAGRRLSSGFTLMELLVVISIIAILLGIIVPSYFSIREIAKYTKAKVTAKNLETAFKAYLDHYRVWPDAWNEDTDNEIKDDVFKILRGDPNMPGNPAAIAFYEFSDSTNAAIGALDSWSDPKDSINTIWQTYRFRVDENYDNKIGANLYRTVIVWSPGADRTNNTSDDVKSWD